MTGIGRPRRIWFEAVHITLMIINAYIRLVGR